MTVCNTSQAVNTALPATSPQFLLYNLVVYCIGIVVVVTCPIGFAIAKRCMRSDRLAVRREVFILTAAVCSIVHMSCTQLPVVLLQKFPCAAYLILAVLVVPLMGGTLLGKLLVFYFYSITAEAVERAAHMTSSASVDSGATPPGQNNASFFKSGRIVLNNLIWGTQMDNDGQWSESLKWLRFIISRRGVITIAMAVLIPFLILAFALLGTDPGYVQCENCFMTPPIIGVIISTGIVLIVMGIVVARRIQHFKDPFGLARECTLFVVCCVLAFFGYLLQTFDPTPTYAGIPLDHTWFVTIAIWMSVVIQTVVPVTQAWLESRPTRVFHSPRSRHQGSGGVHQKIQNTALIAAISPEAVDLDYIVKHPVLSRLFETHVKNELGLESLLFLQDAMTWRLTYYDTSLTHHRARYMRIFRSYIIAGANFEVNLPWHMKEAMTRVAKDTKDGEDIPQVVFDESIEEIKQMLSYGALKRFKASPVFHRALEDLALLRDAGGASVGTGKDTDGMSYGGVGTDA